ncbi:hypothetical protein [Sporolactobacillus shoreicorticis]|uniref:Uncharacterized protein n=1 Tax=Sporolactobacillus shoreicorticis TaxID=1923877 RepID=A0ABW5S7Z5_9BACL
MDKVKFIHRTPRDVLQEFMGKVDDYESIIIVGKKHEDVDVFETGYSYISTSEAFAHLEMGRASVLRDALIENMD